MSTEEKIDDYKHWISSVASRLDYLTSYYEACQNYEMCAILLKY
jgi:hypothetical protein